MWLMTKIGFFSIVQRDGMFHVRSREKKDLENLLNLTHLKKIEIETSSTSDYYARIVIGREELIRTLLGLEETIDYDNFKDAIDNSDDQSHKPYHEIWDIMAEHLGAYGH